MKNPRFPRFVLALISALAALPPLTFAAPPPPESSGRQIPAPLKPWETWATWGDEHRLCPTPYSESGKHLCFWPSRLGLQAVRGGGKFDLTVTVFHETWVPLPGNPEVWPLDVRANGAPVAVLQHEGHPAVRLAAGTFRLEGAYRWNEVPQRLRLPREIGILALAIDGQPVDAPVWDAQGFLWLKRDGSTEEADKNFLAVKLYGVIEDGIPLWLRLEIEVTVSGKSREEDLGTILPEGWKLAAVESPIPVAVDAAGRMKAQVRTGKWTLRADAFRFDNPKEFRFGPDAKPAVAEQLVAFRARPDFRVVEIVGAPSIDVSQTTFPEKWRELPVYRWDTATPFRLEERMRGMGEQKPAGLTIARELWLDENGRGLTFRDHLTGAMQQIWRLDAAPGQDLGSVRSGGQGQLITRNPQNAAPGVEIRTRELQLEATGRMARARELSATGWRTDADALNVTLHLPPGWRLFALFGADWVRGDWLTAWTLLDLFLLLVFSLAVFRLWGLGAGLLAFIAFGLSFHEPGAPRYLWLGLLVPLALQRVVPEGRGRRVVGVGKWLAVGAFVLVLVPFVARQVQQALYPQLEIVSADGRAFGMIRNRPEPPDFAAQTVNETAAEPEGGNIGKIQRKLERIIIPKLEFKEATLREAVDFLKKKSVELDTQSPFGERGVNIVLKLDENPAIPGLTNEQEGRITVSLSNVPLVEALRYVTGLANLKFKVEPYGVAVVPASMNTDILITKEWRVRPDSIPEIGGNSAKDWLVANGVQFNGQASATYLRVRNRLVVRNTQDQLDLIDTIINVGSSAAPAFDSSRSSLGILGVSTIGKGFKGGYSKDNLSYDAKARIQTGPGVPEWKWREVSFGWNGPVSATQQVRPVLIPLAVERGLTVLRVILLLALAALLLGTRKLRGSVFRASGKAAALLALTFLFATAAAQAQAQMPDQATISKLRERLLETSDAYPNAADIPSVALTLNGRKVTLDAEIHTALRTAVPLPGRLPAWSPLTVLVDNKPSVALRRDDGYLWLVLEAGVHRVRVEGLLANVTEWEWTYLLRPRQVKIDAPGWTFSGVKADGVPEAQVFFALQQKTAAGAASYDRQEVQSITVIDRHLELGLNWQVRTTVARLSPVGKAVALRVPLLPGENVLSSNAVVKDGFIEVRLGAQERAFTWESGLAVGNTLQLATRAEDAWVERWHLVASPVWNVALDGLAPVFERGGDNLMPGEADLIPVWHPWPGESASLTISRPEPLAGATVTVSRGTHEITLGRRQRVSELALALRCSLGEDFLVALPADAEITALTHNGRAMPVRKDGGKLIIPVRPGEQNVKIAWKTNVALGVRAQASDVRLPVESANVQTIINVPDDRWVLWASGPRRGPAVRFWVILLCSLLAAVALGRVARSPLHTVEWMLLVIGLTQVPLFAALAVIGWLFLLAWRGGDSFQRLGRGSYNALQVFLIGLTAVALGILLTAVGEGLLGSPEMFITGNGSARTALRWFQARSDNLLPRPSAFSISIWWYRFFMLAWALWLAAALLRWLRRGWQAFTSGGVFRAWPKSTPAPPPLPKPASPGA